VKFVTSIPTLIWILLLLSLFLFEVTRFYRPAKEIMSHMLIQNVCQTETRFWEYPGIPPQNQPKVEGS